MLILTVHIFDNIVRYVPALLISILKTWIQNFNFIDLISIDIPRQWSLLCLSLHVVVVPKNKSDSIKRAPITGLKNDNCANLTSVTKFINFWIRNIKWTLYFQIWTWISRSRPIFLYSCIHSESLIVLPRKTRICDVLYMTAIFSVTRNYRKLCNFVHERYICM